MPKTWQTLFRFEDLSIKRKLTVIIMIASTVALLLVSSGFVAYELITYRQTMRGNLLTLANIVGNQSTAALAYEDQEAAQEILAALAAETHIRAAGLYKAGHLLAHYPAQVPADKILPLKPGREGARFEKDRFIIFHDIWLRGEPLGTICLKSDLQEMHNRFNRYAAILTLMLLTSAVITYWLSAFLQRIISRPIYSLAEIARAVSSRKNYSLRASRHGKDELGQLVDGFNLMLEQIQQRDVALQEANDKLEKRVQERTRELEVEVVERRSAEQALQQQLRRTNLLNRIAQVVSERHDLESILHVVLRQLEDNFGLDLGGVALFNAQTKELVLSALRLKNPLRANRLDLAEGARLPLTDSEMSLCGRGQTLCFLDTTQVPSPLAADLAKGGLASAVAVPLLVENKLFGVMLSVRAQPKAFSSSESEFLRVLSEHVALAAHQARLHQELEQAYNELRQTQQTVMQQERLKALGQMASGIAHDINNALSPIVGFADLLLREQGLSEGGKKHLRYIATAGKDIAHIVARLREFYRRRDEKETVQEVDLNTLAEQVVDMTRPRWRDIPQSKGITIDVQTDFGGGLPRLVAIESEVREALTNLLLNAVDALPKGGRIVLRTRATISESGPVGKSQPSHVLVEVSDSGIGMSEETRKRCLEPFFSTKGTRGTGLGLAMVYGVMERHEGIIEIESQLGQGATFRLIFPVRKAPSAANSGPSANETTAPRHVLYIDDEPLLRELLKELLELDGHQVEVSDGGEAGLNRFRAARERGQPFDLVITDLGMPHLDGRQVAGMIKEESPATPVVLLTGWGALMKEECSLPAPVDAVLSKPPRHNELRELLRNSPKIEQEERAA